MNYRVRDEHQRQILLSDLGSKPLPFSVEVHDGAVPLSDRQRRTAYLWYSEIAKQWAGHDKADVRRFCKLTIGIPILNAVSEEHAYVYNNAVKRTLTYEQKLMLMDCWDVLSSNYMTKEGACEYLTGIWNLAQERFWILTDPEEPAVMRAA